SLPEGDCPRSPEGDCPPPRGTVPIRVSSSDDASRGKRWMIGRRPCGRERLFDRRRIARMATLHRYLPGIAITAATLTLVGAAQRSGKPASYRGWSGYGGGPEQLRYSSLTQINRRNVAKLEVAWTYDTDESGDLQTQPIVAGDILYAYSPNQRVLA